MGNKFGAFLEVFFFVVVVLLSFVVAFLSSIRILKFLSCRFVAKSS